MWDMDALPRFKRLDSAHHEFAPTSESDKTYPLLIERRELGVGGEFRIKYKDRFDSSFDLFPEREKVYYLIISLLAFDISGRVKDELGFCILSEECKCPFHSLATNSSPVLLQNGFFSKVRDSMKVQVDYTAVVKLKLIGLLDKALLQAEQMNCIKAVRICRNAGALGQNIELRKESRPRVKGMLRDMGVPLSAKKLEDQEREKI